MFFKKNEEYLIVLKVNYSKLYLNEVVIWFTTIFEIVNFVATNKP